MIYLASPYSHSNPWVRQNRFEAACRHAAKLMSEGHIVFSPVAHSHPIAEHGKIPPMDHEFWMAQDKALLQHASRLEVLMLPGWMESRGIKEEIEYAEQLGIPVTYAEGKSDTPC